jgi:hypothetical protein
MCNYIFIQFDFAVFLWKHTFFEIEDEVMSKSRMIIEYSVNLFHFNVDFTKVKVLKCTTLTLTFKVKSITLNFNTFLKCF